MLECEDQGKNQCMAWIEGSSFPHLKGLNLLYIIDYLFSVAISIKVFSLIPITGTINKNHAK